MATFLEKYGEQLYPANLFEGLPAYSNDLCISEANAPVFKKFVHPFSGWCWYVFTGTRLSNGDYDLYGYVTNEDGGEIGVFRFFQLQSVLAAPVEDFEGRFDDIFLG